MELNSRQFVLIRVKPEKEDEEDHVKRGKR